MSAMAEPTPREIPTSRARMPPEKAADPLEDAFPETSPPELPLDPLTELLMLAKDVPWRRAPRSPP